MVFRKSRRAKHGHSGPDGVECLKRAGKLGIDAVQALSFPRRGAGGGEEFALMTARSANRQFVAGGADLAPLFLPLAVPVTEA